MLIVLLFLIFFEQALSLNKRKSILTITPKYRLPIFVMTSATRLGDFLKFSAPNSPIKVARKDCLILGDFEKDQFMRKLLRLFFRQLFETFGQLLNPASGHTGHNCYDASFKQTCKVSSPATSRRRRNVVSSSSSSLTSSSSSSSLTLELLATIFAADHPDPSGDPSRPSSRTASWCQCCKTFFAVTDTIMCLAKLRFNFDRGFTKRGRHSTILNMSNCLHSFFLCEFQSDNVRSDRT